MSQLSFWFDFRKRKSEQPSAATTEGRKRQAMQRAVLCWLYGREAPSGVALNVATRIARVKADAAAFWSRARRNPRDEGPRNVLEPTCTAIVQCYTERQDCWADCTKTADIMPELERLRRRRTKLEARIRREEPALRDPNTLFEEYAEWRYEKSANREYHDVHRQIQKLEHALLEGTQFEQIRSAEVADYLYLAVPSGLVKAHELADGWGLLWINRDLTVTLEREAECRDCLDENRLHLVQNIAVAASKSVLFATGIRVRSDGTPYLTQPPRGHRKHKTFQLD
ncbi:MAG: hypothetical protein K9N51_13225 [Candidatus Pacebacteria bacterium]|nr:hypothetical protein [Candidatus Paceibacterota bacterium]